MDCHNLGHPNAQLGFELWVKVGPPWPKTIGFCDLLGAPYAPVSKISSVKVKGNHCLKGLKLQYNNVLKSGWLFYHSLMVNWGGPSPRDNFFGINCKSPRDLFTITLHTTKESTIERDDLADVFSAEHYMTCFLSYAQFKSKKTKTWMHSCNVIFILFSNTVMLAYQST